MRLGAGLAMFGLLLLARSADGQARCGAVFRDGSVTFGKLQGNMDEQLHWSSSEPEVFGRNAPGRQIDVAIPPGHETIDLRLGGRECQGAWAEAGFLLQQRAEQRRKPSR